VAALLGWLVAATLACALYYEGKGNDALESKWREAANGAIQYMNEREEYILLLEDALNDILNQCERVL